MAGRRISEADIDRWVQRGIISPAQRDAILHDLAATPEPEGALNLTTLLYYTGGLLVLVAFGIFLGVQWQELNQGSRLALASVTLLASGGASTVLLRNERFRLPGELLQLTAVAALPRLTFTVLDIAGIWPQEPIYSAAPAVFEAYESDLTWARMALAGVTVLGALGAFALSRSPFVLLAAAAAATSFAVDVSLQASGPRMSYELETGQLLIIAFTGGALLLGGIALQGRTQRDYSLGLYLGGFVGLTVGLAPKAFDMDDPAWGAVWMALAIAVLGLSVPLQQRLFLAAGLLGVFAYLAKLVFDIFESALAALVLILFGVIILGVGLAYQRLTERPAGDSSPTALS